MSYLYERLREQVAKWRDTGYRCKDYPAISELLEYSLDENQSPHYLRQPQFRSLETYWYLRLVEKTPHIFDLYKHSYENTDELIESLGIRPEAFKLAHYKEDILFDRIRTDDSFVKSFKLEALRETLTLDYPSYIFALAMGAGKTILIGTIIATEFAMALEYPDGPFIQNALVFAPGKTIFEALRELAEIPFERILPPRLHKPFSASYKLIFTRDGDPDIPVTEASSFNLIVTNTEKIRIQKKNIKKKNMGSLFIPKEKEEEIKQEVANRRLQKIASLPHLGIFSDEAHHTYGQAMETELKKVRMTVDFLHENTDVVCVVNTTGTPYYKRQILKDVVFWYGLSQGIEDGYLKEVSGNIRSYSFDDSNTDEYVRVVVKDFFERYGDVKLPDGSPAKLAIYFPQVDDLQKLRPVVETTLVEIGLSPSLVLECHNKAPQAQRDAFNRFKFPDSLHRIALLVNMGTEGWNCPNLFACALARRLKTSNNFVLQTSSRCLRQIPGNAMPASIYLSSENRSILDRQLQETYGESIADLDRHLTESIPVTLKLRKLDIPQLVVKQIVRTVIPAHTSASKNQLKLTKPSVTGSSKLIQSTLDIQETIPGRGVLIEVDRKDIETLTETVDLYRAAMELAAIYRLDVSLLYRKLKALYGDDREIPAAHVDDLAKQIEKQTSNYKIKEETIERALALIRPEGFDRSEEDGVEVYTAEISYPKSKEELLTKMIDFKKVNPRGFGFHYDPYNFDSAPEQSFFTQLLSILNRKPEEVEDIYFTGGLTDPKKTDFFVEYLGEDNKTHRYTPDFVIRCKDGRTLIVEIKDERLRDNKIDGVKGRKAMAVRKWEDLDPERLKYEIIFAKGDSVAYDRLKPAKDFVEEKSNE